MSLKLHELQDKIQSLKKGKKVSASPKNTQGYSIALVMMTDLVACVLVGLGLGIFFQKFFYTSILLTATLTLLGGIAGLYTVIRFAMEQDKK